MTQASKQVTTVKSLIKEFELNDLMGKIIDHCFDRWSQKDLLIANRVKQFVSDFMERKLQAHQKELLAKRDQEWIEAIEKGYDQDGEGLLYRSFLEIKDQLTTLETLKEEV